MNASLPPIYRDCRRLLVATEELVRHFARYHKYTVGTDLRRAAMRIMRTASRAVHDKPHTGEHVQALVWQVDDYKLTLQLGMDVGAVAQSVKTRGQSVLRPAPGFHHFESAATLAASIGKQCGGWHQALARRQRAQQVGGSAGQPAPATAGPLPQALPAASPASLSGGAAPGTVVPGARP